MNKIVIERYPVSSLPADIRAAFGAEGLVTVTLESTATAPTSRDDLVRQLRREKQQMTGQGVTVEQAAARIRQLRDEWSEP